MGINQPKIKLHGFNNLTKTLSFNFYDICYAHTQAHRREYLHYIDEVYNSERLQRVLSEVVDIIGANVLSISAHDYEPRGSSVACLMAEKSAPQEIMVHMGAAKDQHAGIKPSAVLHLDKSHVTAHTYPESHPDHGISTFRVDIDVSTCGQVSPLEALNFLIDSFDEDIIILDYRVRGFTRDTFGQKHYIDHEIASIQDFLSDTTRRLYQITDMNVEQENIFHTRMKLLDFRLENYLFGNEAHALGATGLQAIEQQLRKEMNEIFYGISTPG